MQFFRQSSKYFQGTQTSNFQHICIYAFASKCFCNQSSSPTGSSVRKCGSSLQSPVRGQRQGGLSKEPLLLPFRGSSQPGSGLPECLSSP